MLTCDEVRRLLWPLDRPRECGEREEEARSHLESCEECARFFDLDARITRGIRARGLEAAASAELRERVFDALARERALGGTGERTGGPSRSPASRRFRIAAPWLLAAASVAAISFVVLRPDPGEVEVAYAQDFMSRAVEADAVEGPDARAVSAFFMREFGTSIPAVVPEESSITRAMVCLIDGRRAAMVEYALKGHTLAHYRIPVETSGMAAARGPSMTDQDGVCVYRWTDGRFEQALVSDMPPAELEALARLHFAIATR